MTTEQRSLAAFGEPSRGPDDFDDRPGVLASLSRYRVPVMAATLLVAAAAYVLASLLPVQYKAEATLILRDSGAPTLLSSSNGSGQPADQSVAVAKQADIATSTVVLARALRMIGSDQSVRDARKDLDVRPSKDSAALVIDAKAGSAASARALANAVGTSYQQIIRQRTITQAHQAIAGIDRLVAGLQAQLDSAPSGFDGSQTPQQQALSSQIADLKQRQQDIATELAVSPSGVELFERADLPPTPSQPKPKLLALLGAVLGAVGAGGWAWWSAGRNQRAERPQDPARILGAPLLGEVPRFRPPRPPTGEAMPSPPSATDAYHFVLASLEHELESVGGTSVALTGVAPGDGTTTTALHIAIAARQEDRKVALIDANQRSPGLTELCGLEDGDGAPAEPDRTPVEAEEYLGRLAVTHSGIVLPVPSDQERGRMSRLLRPPWFRKALLSLGEQFDLVLIDTPPLLTVSDAIPISRQADGVVVVVDRDAPLSDLRAIRERLGFVSTPLIGYVFVQKRGRRPGPPGRLGRLGSLARLATRRNGDGAG